MMPLSPDADIFVAARLRHQRLRSRESLHAGGEGVFDVLGIADVDVVVDRDHHVEILECAEGGEDGVALQSFMGGATPS